MKQPDSIAGWESTIAKLERDLVALGEQNETVRRDRRELSLSIALGNEAARQAAEQLELTGAGLALEIRNTTEAIESARTGLRTAVEAQRAEQERERAIALAEALEARKAAAERLDDGLSTMAGALVQWLAFGDRITTLGGDGHSTRAKGQLAAAVWHHLSESGLNRADPWQYRTVADVFSGDSRPSPARWRPLADNS